MGTKGACFPPCSNNTLERHDREKKLGSQSLNAWVPFLYQLSLGGELGSDFQEDELLSVTGQGKLYFQLCGWYGKNTMIVCIIRQKNNDSSRKACRTDRGTECIGISWIVHLIVGCYISCQDILNYLSIHKNTENTLVFYKSLIHINTINCLNCNLKLKTFRCVQ